MMHFGSLQRVHCYAYIRQEYLVNSLQSKLTVALSGVKVGPVLEEQFKPRSSMETLSTSSGVMHLDISMPIFLTFSTPADFTLNVDMT